MFEHTKETVTLLVIVNGFFLLLNNINDLWQWYLYIRNKPKRKYGMCFPTYWTSDSSDCKWNLYTINQNVSYISTMAVQVMTTFGTGTQKVIRG